MGPALGKAISVSDYEEHSQTEYSESKATLCMSQCSTGNMNQITNNKHWQMHKVQLRREWLQTETYIWILPRIGI